MLAIAMALDAWLGEPKWLWDRAPHPAVLMGRAIGWADRTFNSGENRKLKGLAVIAALIAGAWVLGGLIALVPVLDILLAAVLIAQRSLVDHVGDVGDALEISVEDGRAAVAKIVGRDASGLDDNGIARAAIESGAENLSDGIVAPVFWYMVAGLPGMLAYKAINTADSMIGYRTDRHAQFGWAAARIDDVVNWIPARLTAGLIVLGHWQRGLMRLILRDAKLHRSPNAGWPEAAMAGVLEVALSGPRSYDGQMRDEPFVNPDGRKAVGLYDLRRSVGVLWRVWVLLFVIAVIV